MSHQLETIFMPMFQNAFEAVHSNRIRRGAIAIAAVELRGRCAYRE